MVEVNEKLYVSADAFFNSIAESVAYDISDSTGKKIRPKQIKKGYSYTKVMKNKVKRKGDVSITISKWNPPYAYAAEFSSLTGVNYLSYEIEDLEGGYIGVTYREDFKGVSKSKDLNFKLVNVFFKKKAKRRAIKLLRAIEKYAQEEQVKKDTKEEATIDTK
ncbi:MAG: DUF3284 domain-containing protein [Longicatena sp.]